MSNRSNTPWSDSPEAASRSFLVFYSVLLVLALIWGGFSGTLRSAWSIEWSHRFLIRCGGSTVLLTLLLFVSSALYESFAPESYARIRSIAASLFPDRGRLFLVGVALFSSLSEEMFFRLGVQGVLGWIGAGVVFGLLHWDRFASPWTLFALVAGLLIAWVYEQTGSIYPVWISHFLLNAWGFLRTRRAPGRLVAKQGPSA